MQLIPVIDIKDHQAVYAIAGKRSEYRPLNTPLCRSSDPRAVLERFLLIGDFKKVYVADLNAITGKGNNARLIAELLTHYPDVCFWIDNGSMPGQSLPPSYTNWYPVIGSESLHHSQLGTLNNLDPHWILSLDFMSQQKLGPEILFSDTVYWPEEIIIMTLDRVGTQTGPALQKLASYCRKYPQKNFIAAGGIRNLEDLLNLKMTGVHSALVASALHTGQIGAEEIRRLSAE